jgi:hypothetical protein
VTLTAELMHVMVEEITASNIDVLIQVRSIVMSRFEPIR